MGAIFVAEIRKVINPDRYDAYRQKARKIVETYGGRYLARGGQFATVVGGWNPEALVVIEFPSREALDKCFSSEEYRAIVVLREGSVEAGAVIAEVEDEKETESEVSKTAWQWNEMQQVGTDYGDISEIEAYEKRMGEFRDIDGENTAILELLNLPGGARIMEIGCGTGKFARMAAGKDYRVTAADISSMMLKYIGSRASVENLDIECVNAGFLGIPERDGEYDAVVSGAALHHLPDVWKTVAVEKIFRLLKPGGQFVVRDVFFDWKEEGHAEFFERFVAAFPESTRKAAARHAEREFSTHGWIMEEMLKRAGFTVLSNKEESFYFRQYHCRK
ncbi:MAG: DUF1330 domain-containing protein [Planctomycetes bacterium]|nr:DUF1330 domain-containing protein [Planctomycetota bacterium]